MVCLASCHLGLAIITFIHGRKHNDFISMPLKPLLRFYSLQLPLCWLDEEKYVHYCRLVSLVFNKKLISCHSSLYPVKGPHWSTTRCLNIISK